MVQSLGETPTQAKLEELLSTQSESLDLNAINGMLPAIREQRKSKQDVINAFKVFDNRSDGHITVDNFRTMMGSVGEKLSPSEVTAAVDKAYEIAPGELDDGVKAIKYEAYVEWMMGSQT